MPRKDPAARAQYLREHEAAIAADPTKLALRRAQQRAAHKRRYAADPEKYREKGRRNYWANPKKENVRSAAYRAADPERHRQCSQRSRAKKPWLSLLSAARSRAVEKGIAFTLTPVWAKERYTGRCELSHVLFESGIGAGQLKAHPYSASIDRIDQSKGYVPDNCRFILRALNMFRGTCDDKEMLAIAEALLAKRLPNS